MAMVRKQVYLESVQDEKVKRLAHELGVTEAEIIRRAIDSLVEYTGGGASEQVRVRDAAAVADDASREVEGMEKKQKQLFNARRLDHLAWEEELAFIESRAAALRGTVNEAEKTERTWTRDDLYDKRRLRLPD